MSKASNEFPCCVQSSDMHKGSHKVLNNLNNNDILWYSYASKCWNDFMSSPHQWNDGRLEMPFSNRTAITQQCAHTHTYIYTHTGNQVFLADSYAIGYLIDSNCMSSQSISTNRKNPQTHPMPYVTRQFPGPRWLMVTCSCLLSWSYHQSS